MIHCKTSLRPTAPTPRHSTTPSPHIFIEERDRSVLEPPDASSVKQNKIAKRMIIKPPSSTYVSTLSCSPVSNAMHTSQCNEESAFYFAAALHRTAVVVVRRSLFTFRPKPSRTRHATGRHRRRRRRQRRAS